MNLRKYINKLGVCIALFSLSLLFGGTYAVKHELNDHDKALLSDIDRFNETVRDSGWHISNVIIEDLDLSRINLNKSSLRFSDLNEITIENGFIQNTTFEDVIFEEPQFSNTQFKNVQFINCTFFKPNFVEVTFVNSNFKKCKFEEAQIEKSLIHDTSFEHLSDKRSTFEESNLNNISFDTSTLHYTSFYNGEVDNMTFQSTNLNEVKLYNMKINKMRFDSCTLNRSSFTKGMNSGLTFTRCRSDDGFRFIKTQMSDTRFEQCSNMNFLTIHGSISNNFSFNSCQNVINPAFIESKIKSISIAYSELSDLDIYKSEITAGSIIGNSTINGLNLKSSKSLGLTIENSTIARYLVLKDAQFENLKLKNITYKKPLDVIDEGVKYTNSDIFSAK